MATTGLVSVIIPCFNQGHFLATAIESVLQQTYPLVEVLVIDDGSQDTTQAVAARYASVRYFYQPNQGLAAARNTGLGRSQGTYLLFLDADDWLYPQAIALNIRYLEQNPGVAFVAGAYELVDSEEHKIKVQIPAIQPDPYLTLLAWGNYLGMIAAITFHRWALEEFPFDAAYRRCEDYELYLRITRKYAIVQHQEKIAGYRIHATSLSADIPAMLRSALHALEGQKASLRTVAEQQAMAKGIGHWKKYYYTLLCDAILTRKTAIGKEALLGLLLYSPSLFLRFYVLGSLHRYTTFLKRHLPRPVLSALHKMGLVNQFLPPIGQIAYGDFNRLTPLCANFGFTRGGAIDRYYVENFLRAESACIKDRVLEIGDNSYTLHFGGEKVSVSDILHVDASNLHATYIGDLGYAPQLPDNAFDCLILTQTLHLIYDFKGALQTCHRILKPGGTLLLTVPGITPIDPGEWKETWYWSFTDKALRRIVTEVFGQGQVSTQSFGNVHVAAAFLYGVGRPELSSEKLDFYDPQFQVINTVKAVKSFSLAPKTDTAAS
jgi:glycosyltransferase involved in cell wall biosynthesis